VASVALLRSYASIAYNQAETQLSAILAEQALIQARIPFDLVFDRHLADLSKYRVLVLPDSECLSDAQIASVRRFVEQGGGLVAIGQAGLYDEWRRLRVRAGLAELIDGQAAARGYQERVEHTEIAGQPVRRQVGQGRSVYLPALRFDGELPEMGNYFSIGNRFWKRPRNWQELGEAVRWAAREEMPVRVEGPEYLAANVTAQPEQRRTMVHLVNYNARRAAIAQPVEVWLPAAAEVELYAPELAETRRLDVRKSGGGAVFSVPSIQVYAIAVVR
jgi:hypothetical protein